MDTGTWPQLLIEFTDWHAAEQTVVNLLRPQLRDTSAGGVLQGWWLLRKYPCWRLRYPPDQAGTAGQLTRTLDQAVDAGQIAGWSGGIYEPETLAFGGPAGLDVAHELAHADSCAILDYLADTGPSLGRRELGVLLCTALLNGAGLDWYEQGDVWAKVADHRPAAHNTTDRHRAMIRHLMTINTTATTVASAVGQDLLASPLGGYAAWLAAFDQAGRRLAEHAYTGALLRGLRHVLAHQVIFASNRLGLSAAEQATLSTLATQVVMGVRPPRRHEVSTAMTDPSTPPGTDLQHTTTGQPQSGATPSSADSTEVTDAEAGRLRNALVDELVTSGVVRSQPVEQAMRTVPRHLFVPSVSLAEAYADDAVYTKQDGDGTNLSAASQPRIVAMMLEQLAIEPGDRVLEAGAGTGYNAALLAQLTGATGRVTTIDVDDDIVAGARTGLATAGYPDVQVLCGDGAAGHPDAAPYDRIIATVGAYDLPPAWLDQLADGGRIVVPLRLRGSVSRAITFERDDHGGLVSVASAMSTFMPLRGGGIADDPRGTVALTPDIGLHTNHEQTIDPAALTDIFDQPRHQEWTGVRFAATESQELLWLWLACTLPGSLSRMPVAAEAVEAAVVAPAFGWGTMATAEKSNLAYLTLRPAGTGTDGGRLFEIGVIGHGPGGDELTNRMADEIRTWHHNHRNDPVQFGIHVGTEAPINHDPHTFVFTRPHSHLTITWH